MSVTNHLIFPKGEAKNGSGALLELIAILLGGKIISSIINNFPGEKRLCDLFTKDCQDCMIQVHVVFTKHKHNKKTAKPLTFGILDPCIIQVQWASV
jgi:hypothetical protein